MAKPKKQVQEFTIKVMRTSYAFRDIKVQAKTQKEAEELALDEAGDHDYSERDADYSIAR
ncbi:MAG: hypothetical protein IM618_10940 [Cytophagales bacterium]|jgi:hypothetical protein|nr:hypothetical protein [Cytophagales bacterium]